jgi:cytoskeletal protein RodZ
MSADEASAELPLDGTGGRLRRARETQGLSRTDIAQRTRIPERHLAAIEGGDFAALPGRTYAVGFVRTYARAVGLPESPLIEELRAELGRTSAEPPPPPAFEPGDPARVPGARLAWLAALAGLMAALGGGFYWSGYSFTVPGLPSILPAETPAPRPAPPRPAPPVAVAPATNPVVLTATAAAVWLRITDAAEHKLFEGELAPGQSFTVPADAVHPVIRTGHPEALAITVGGRAVPPLADHQQMIRETEVSGVALLARPAPGAPPLPNAAPNAPGSSAPPATAAPAAIPHRPRPRPSPVATAAAPAASSAEPAAAQTSTVSQ